jgi:hypothetical protein
LVQSDYLPKGKILPADIPADELKDKILTPAEQAREGKHADGRVEPRYLFKQIPVEPEVAAKIKDGKSDADVLKQQEKSSGT